MTIFIGHTEQTDHPPGPCQPCLFQPIRRTVCKGFGHIQKILARCFRVSLKQWEAGENQERDE
jgi:hypothetical protein